jgi:hypothetical protein
MQFIGNAKISKGDNGVSLCFERPLEEQDDTCYLSRIPVYNSYITIVTTLRGTPVEVNFPDDDLVLPDQALRKYTAHEHVICWLHALLGTDAVKQIAAGEETFTLILDHDRLECWRDAQALATRTGQMWSRLLENYS